MTTIPCLIGVVVDAASAGDAAAKMAAEIAEPATDKWMGITRTPEVGKRAIEAWPPSCRSAIVPLSSSMLGDQCGSLMNRRLRAPGPRSEMLEADLKRRPDDVRLRHIKSWRFAAPTCHSIVTNPTQTRHKQLTFQGSHVEKSQAVALLGERRLMLPAWVKAALAANDRLKVYLTVLQDASDHAGAPERDAPDLAAEFAAAGLTAPWLADAVGEARRVEEGLAVPDLDRIVAALG